MSQFETNAIRLQTERTQYNEHATPLFLTSSFVFDTAEAMSAAFAEETDDFVYSRYGNPSTEEFVQKIAALEGAESGIATASGMAAVYTTFAALLQSGDHILSCASIFGATHTLFQKYFPKFGIRSSYFNAGDTAETIEALITPSTKLLYLETPTNPALEVIDLELIGKIAAKHRLIFAVDNCFATPYLQQPASYGADLIIHSATKYIDGQGRVLGGVVVGKAHLIRELYLFNRLAGASLSPFNAWILSKSLETLALRMERHCQNAEFIAQSLVENAALHSVKYPFLPSHPHYAIAKKQMKGGGGILTFIVKGGYESGKKLMDSLKMIKISPNLGDSRTIATHPASSTHCKLSPEERKTVGIDEGLIRLSIGLEHKDDILADISQALAKL